MRRSKERSKAHHISCTSGPEPVTAPSLALPDAVSVRKIPLTHSDRFVCVGAVDLQKLLRASRASLYDNAEHLGANVLIDEQWSATICGPKHRNDGTFKVNIRYQASAARSEKRDPCRPVALDQARGVPGLMTIIERVD